MTAARLCARCGKPLSKERQRKKHCYRCECAVKREQKEAAHRHRVEKLYGLLPGDYDALYRAQNGRCAVKGCRARGIRKHLPVDHDHKLGLHNREAVRGLACSLHNKWIGQAGDDPEVFDSLAAYLRNPPARKVLTDANPLYRMRAYRKDNHREGEAVYPGGRDPRPSC